MTLTPPPDNIRHRRRNPRLLAAGGEHERILRQHPTATEGYHAPDAADGGADRGRVEGVGAFLCRGLGGVWVGVVVLRGMRMSN